jgi:hypothetical protein
MKVIVEMEMEAELGFVLFLRSILTQNGDSEALT